MKWYVKLILALIFVVFSIIIIPAIVVIGLSISTYFIFEMIVVYFKTINDIFKKKKDNTAITAATIEDFK